MEDTKYTHIKAYRKKKPNSSISYLRIQKSSLNENIISNYTTINEINKNIHKKEFDNNIKKENKENQMENMVTLEKDIPNSLEENELKIVLYPNNKPRNNFEKEPLKNILKGNTIEYSFDKNKELGFINSNVPLLNGFYQAYINHYPIRIKPDDIWLLIIQAFTHHVNTNHEKLRKYFVNFKGKINCNSLQPFSDVSEINRGILENFADQMNEKIVEYIGNEILEILTPNFTTTNYNSKIIGKISIMGAFRDYFKYIAIGYACGIPYIILEGTSEDYRKIKYKAEYLKKYKFDWYIDRILPIVQKMIDAKNGKIDIEFFKKIIQEKEVEEKVLIGCSYKSEKINYINGWLVKFFAYYNSGAKNEDNQIKFKEFKDLANQLLIVPFTVLDCNKKKYEMEYHVGFIGCDKNKKNEVFPVQGWFVNSITKEER